MLEMLVSRLPNNQLSELINNDSQNLAEKIFESPVSKEKLIKAVITKFGIKLIVNKSLREMLIQLMRPDEVIRLVSAYQNINESEDFWELARKYTQDDLFPLAKMLEIEKELKSTQQTAKQIKDVDLSQPNYQLYPYQRRVVGKVMEYLRSDNTERVLVHLPTGAGKTRTAFNIVSEHIRETEEGLVLWLADSEELCSQAANEAARAWSYLGNRELSVYSYYGDSSKTLNGIKKGVLVAGLQRLNSRKNGKEEYYFKQILERVTLIVFDEAHKIIAKTYAETVESILQNGCPKFLLGLTATPGRSLFNEDEDIKLSRFFNNLKVTMEVPGYSEPLQYLIDNKYLAEPNYLPIDYEGSDQFEITANQLKEEAAFILKQLSEVETRNAAIIKQAIKEYESDSSIIIFACNVEHAIILAETLSCLGYPAVALTSSNDDAVSRRVKIQQYKNKEIRILVNFGILTTGFDAPCTNVAIIARPTTSLVLYSQMAGRAMRGAASGGNEDCNIYTVLDNIPEFTDLFRAFGHWNNNWKEINQDIQNEQA